MKKYVIPVFIPYDKKNHDWILKNQKIENEEVEKINSQKLTEIIDKHISKIRGFDNREVAFLGADFTTIEQSLQEELLQTLQRYISNGIINNIKVSIRPNNITKQTLKILKKYKVKTIELEVYSTNDYILKRIGMNFDLKDIKKKSRQIRFKGFKLGYQMMIGLPDSTKLDDINTAKTLSKLKTTTVTINPVFVIKDTELEKEYNSSNYKPLTIVQAIETCKEIIKIFNDKKIETNAIGFEPTNNVLAGPFHPAFRSLVESSLWYDAIVNKIKKLNTKVMEVEVTVNPSDTNNVVGYKQENIEKLKNTYDVDLIVTSDENMKQGKSKIEITKVFEN